MIIELKNIHEMVWYLYGMDQKEEEMRRVHEGWKLVLQNCCYGSPNGCPSECVASC